MCSSYVCISIYTSVLPGLPPSLGSKSQGVFVQVTPTQYTPHPHPQLCVRSSHNLLCCFAWLCSYGESGNPAVPKARPQRAGRQKQGQAVHRRGGKGRAEAAALRSAEWSCHQVRIKWPPISFSEKAGGVQPSRHSPWIKQVSTCHPGHRSPLPTWT